MLTRRLTGARGRAWRPYMVNQTFLAGAYVVSRRG